METRGLRWRDNIRWYSVTIVGGCLKAHRFAFTWIRLKSCRFPRHRRFSADFGGKGDTEDPSNKALALASTDGDAGLHSGLSPPQGLPNRRCVPTCPPPGHLPLRGKYESRIPRRSLGLIGDENGEL